MSDIDHQVLSDTGERMIPPGPGEVSFVWERHRFAYAYAARFCQGKRVLDLGCGTGYGSHLLAQTAKHVVAIDNSAEAIAYCTQNYQAPNLEYLVADAHAIPGEKAFDVTLSFQVIEHVKDPVEFLTRMWQATAPGGTILVSTPNVRNPDPESKNPFHMSEMNAAMFSRAAGQVFNNFEMRGIGYARPNALRRVLQRTPIYALGRMLKRSSAVKRVADAALDLRAFQVLTADVEQNAIDLLLVAHVDDRTRSGA